MLERVSLSKGPGVHTARTLPRLPNSTTAQGNTIRVLLLVKHFDLSTLGKLARPIMQ